MSFGVDNHLFGIETKVFQADAISSAMEKARDSASQVSTSAKANRVARGICREAFTRFKTNIEAKFPADEYKDLIYLTLESRENHFFVTLQRQVVEVLYP